MNNTVVILRNILSLLASWTVYNDHNANGHSIGDSPDAGVTSSGSHHTDSPFITASIVTTVHDYRNEISTAVRSYTADSRYYKTGEKTIFEAIGLRNTINENDVDLIVSSWDFLKKRISDFAPKIFLRYLNVRPDVRTMFPAIAHVTNAELPYNREFLSTVYNCLTSLNYIIPHLKYSLPGRCPAFADLRSKYTKIDFKILGNIWLNTMQEEMGDRNFTEAVRDSWKRVFLALYKYTYE